MAQLNHSTQETGDVALLDDPNASAAAQRTLYSDHQREIVVLKYHLADNPSEKMMLARQAGIPTLNKIYNLGSREGATRKQKNGHKQWTAERERYTAVGDKARWQIRDDYHTTRWSSDDDAYIRNHFGRTFIEDIGFFLERSETAVAYRARRLGLRQTPQYYDLERVSAWLGLSTRELFLHAIKDKVLQLFPCCDKTGKIAVTLVSTESLSRFLLKDNYCNWLIDNRNADVFFIEDVLQSMVSIQRSEDAKLAHSKAIAHADEVRTAWQEYARSGAPEADIEAAFPPVEEAEDARERADAYAKSVFADFESNVWVSHGHTSLNPWSKTTFNYFFNGRFNSRNDDHWDLDPRDLSPKNKPGSDEWRRGSWKRD